MDYQTDEKFTLFKEKNSHPACIIYERICTCNWNYNGETK